MPIQWFRLNALRVDIQPHSPRPVAAVLRSSCALPVRELAFRIFGADVREAFFSELLNINYI